MCCIAASTESFAGRRGASAGGNHKRGRSRRLRRRSPPSLKVPPHAPLPYLSSLCFPRRHEIFHKSEHMFPTAFCAERRKKITVLSLLHAFVQQFAREGSAGVSAFPFFILFRPRRHQPSFHNYFFTSSLLPPAFLHKSVKP